MHLLTLTLALDPTHFLSPNRSNGKPSPNTNPHNYILHQKRHDDKRSNKTIEIIPGAVCRMENREKQVRDVDDEEGEGCYGSFEDLVCL